MLKRYALVFAALPCLAIASVESSDTAARGGEGMHSSQMHHPQQHAHPQHHANQQYHHQAHPGAAYDAGLHRGVNAAGEAMPVEVAPQPVVVEPEDQGTDTLQNGNQSPN